MKNWKKKVIDAGSIIEGSKKDVTFNATETIPVITHLQSSCGCTTPEYDETLKVLRVTYSAGKVPVHLRQSTKKSIVSQSITVTYADESKDILSFNITVKMK